MEELRDFVLRARQGDLESYAWIVRRFQDMAYGYAYSHLGDFHLAEDAAQEAFVEAYSHLNNLRAPETFPGWFRKIVFKHCDRIARRRQPGKLSPEVETRLPSREPDPGEAVARKEMAESVMAAMQSLPEPERTVTTLFYINGYSHNDIAAFLEVPATTVNNRLHASRERLRERMVNMVADEMKSHPLPEQFPKRIRLLLELPRPLEIEGHPVKEMWDLFRSCFPHFEVLELEEVISRETWLSQDDHDVKVAYAVDEERVLRSALTSLLVRRWQRQGGGFCQLVAAGRIFRRGQNVGPTNLEVHHQAEILWSRQGLDERRCIEIANNVASTLLPGIECRQEGDFSYAPVPKAVGYAARWKDRWLGIAVGGMVEKTWLSRMGLDPQRDGAISLCFGLDRCAQVRYDLDDIRKLWQPPYVPK